MHVRMSSLLFGPGGGKWAMQRTSSVLLAGIFLFPRFLQGRNKLRPTLDRPGIKALRFPRRTAAVILTRHAKPYETRNIERRALAMQAESGGALQMNRASPYPADLQQEFTIAKEKEDAFQ